MLIFTGRFQPFHNGHLAIIDYLNKTYPNEVICVAIIKDFPFINPKDDFDKRVDIELSKSIALFNSETILQLINEVLIHRNYTNVVTTLMPRASVESWNVIECLFDSERTWVFTDNRLYTDLWEKSKVNFYHSKHEDVLLVPINKAISGSDIREIIEKKEFEKLEEFVPYEIFNFICNLKNNNVLNIL